MFVGIINTIVDFSILNILVFVFGLNNIVANTISVSVAMLVSYVLNHTIVFRYQGKNHAKNIVLFVVNYRFWAFCFAKLSDLSFVHLYTSRPILATSIIHALGFDSLSKEFITLNFAKAVATGVTMVWNYFMYKKFVFNDKNVSNKKTPDNQTS